MIFIYLARRRLPDAPTAGAAHEKRAALHQRWARFDGKIGVILNVLFICISLP
jgi:hypothetical protein